VPQYILAQRRIGGGVRNLRASDVIAADIMEDLEAALEEFREIAGDLGANGKDSA
jgi:hypothetical protein